MKTEGVDIALPIKSDPEAAPAKDNNSPIREAIVKKEDTVKGWKSRYIDTI